jgi:hypothetical protein
MEKGINAYMLKTLSNGTQLRKYDQYITERLLFLFEEQDKTFHPYTFCHTLYIASSFLNKAEMARNTALRFSFR